MTRLAGQRVRGVCLPRHSPLSTLRSQMYATIPTFYMDVWYSYSSPRVWMATTLWTDLPPQAPILVLPREVGRDGSGEFTDYPHYSLIGQTLLCLCSHLMHISVTRDSSKLWACVFLGALAFLSSCSALETRRPSLWRISRTTVVCLFVWYVLSIQSDSDSVNLIVRIGSSESTYILKGTVFFRVEGSILYHIKQLAFAVVIFLEIPYRLVSFLLVYILNLYILFCLLISLTYNWNYISSS